MSCGGSVDGSRSVPVRKPRASGLNERRAELATRVEHGDLDVARPQRVLVLHCRDRVHGVRTAQRRCGDFRQADLAHLAATHEVGQRADAVLDRHLRIEPVQVVQIDALGTEPREAFVAVLPDRPGTAVDGALAVDDAHAAFRREHEARTIGAQRWFSASMNDWKLKIERTVGTATRITMMTGMVVQMISISTLPWVWPGIESSPARRRYFTMTNAITPPTRSITGMLRYQVHMNRSSWSWATGPAGENVDCSPSNEHPAKRNVRTVTGNARHNHLVDTFTLLGRTSEPRTAPS